MEGDRQFDQQRNPTAMEEDQHIVFEAVGLELLKKKIHLLEATI
jgi:hypothetical protein